MFVNFASPLLCSSINNLDWHKYKLLKAKLYFNNRRSFSLLLKFLSCNATSKEAFAKITPVNPPIVNKAINPKVNIKGVVNCIEPPYNVAQS